MSLEKLIFDVGGREIALTESEARELLADLKVLYGHTSVDVDAKGYQRYTIDMLNPENTGWNWAEH